METQTLTVPNITCGHCVMSIKNELSELKGVKRVEGDPEARTITVDWEAPASLEQLRATLQAINYPAQ